MLVYIHLYVYEHTVHSTIILHNIYDIQFCLYIPINIFMYVGIYMYIYLCNMATNIYFHILIYII